MTLLNRRLLTIGIVLYIVSGAGSSIVSLVLHQWGNALVGLLLCAFGPALGWYEQSYDRATGRRPMLPSIVMLCFGLVFAVIFFTRLFAALGLLGR